MRKGLLLITVFAALPVLSLASALSRSEVVHPWMWNESETSAKPVKKVVPSLTVELPNASAVRIGSDDTGWIHLKKVKEGQWSTTLDHLTLNKLYWTMLVVVIDGKESTRRIEFKAVENGRINGAPATIQQAGSWSGGSVIRAGC